MYCDGPLYGEVIRISERGQITIPKQLRDQFGLTHNVEVEITPTEKGLLVRKHTTSKHPVDRVHGILDSGESVDDYIEAIRGR